MEEIIELTKQLIRFKSMHSNPGEIHRCVDFIESYFNDLGVTCTRLNYENVPSLLVLPTDGFARVLIMTHIDVVDGADDLFEPRVKDNKLYGRGSNDDKYAAAVSMILFKRHLEKLRAKGRGVEQMPFGLLITGDEEIGGANGASKALDHVRTDFCLAIDGGDPQRIVVKSKGVLKLKLTEKGLASHGARPWQGDNAIEKLISDFQIIKSYFEETNPEHWHRTLNFSMINAGKSFNQVPDLAEGVFDIRFTENDDVEALLAEMRGRIKGELVVEAHEPMLFSGKSPYLDLLFEVTPEAGPGVEHGASDARFLTVKGIPGVVWGADGENTAHTRDEHITLDSLAVLYDRLDKFLSRVGQI